MIDAPFLQISTVIIVALGLIFSALIISLVQYYKKKFLDDVFYQKYYRFWRSLTTTWYFGGVAYLELFLYIRAKNMSGILLDDLGYFILSVMNTLYFSLLYFSIPLLVLLLVSLIPAKLQNWYGKSCKEQ